MIRDDVLMKLVDQSMSDPTFRQQARSDLDGALRASGYELNPEELAAVHEFHATVVGLSDSELQQVLSGDARRQFGS